MISDFLSLKNKLILTGLSTLSGQCVATCQDAKQLTGLKQTINH